MIWDNQNNTFKDMIHLIGFFWGGGQKSNWDDLDTNDLWIGAIVLAAWT